MNVLAEFLATHQQAIIERCASQMQPLLAPHGLTQQQATDHLPALLEELGRSLRQGDEPPSSRMMRHSSAARSHGLQRMQMGFDLNSVVREYGLLRDCVYEQMQEANLQPSLHEVRLLAAGLSGGVADSVTQYVASQNEERDLLFRELTRSNAALDQFAYVVSHDLKAPLRGIANLATWIEDDLGESESDETRQHLLLMKGRVQQLDRMITGILTYSTAGRCKDEPESLDVGALVTEVIDLLDPPGRVAITVGPAMPCLVTERVPLQQVFLNLIGNAVKYTSRDDARVQVDSYDEGASVHVTVTDNGPGIAPKDQERIWGVFQKLGGHREVEGTGIGLSVVKRIVESRGGRTWVESSEGQGATFHVLWPRRPSTIRP